MRTSDICPTCSVFTNALCTLYNGAYLPTLEINTLESMEVALTKIETWASTITPTVLGDITDVDLTGLVDGQQIQYNSTSGNWEPVTPTPFTGYIVATLPIGASLGDRAYVTDALAPTYLGALTGGGAIVCPVFYNGSAWISA